MLHLFFLEFKVSSLYRPEAPSKSLQDFTLCCQLLFLFIILLLPEFFMEALHGASSRILFILQLFVKNSLGVKIRQAILKNKHGVQHMFCFVESKHSSSCILKCNSFYLIIWGGVMSFLITWVRVSWFTCCQEWDILNPPISSLDLSCVMLLLWCLSMIQVFSYPLGERSFSSPWCSHSTQWLPLVAVCHLIMLRCFHKPTTSFSFSLLVFQQLRSILLHKDAL